MFFCSACQKFEEQFEKLRELIAKTEELDMKKMDFEQRIDLLKTTIHLYSEIKNHWSKMVQFLLKLTNIIDVCLTSPVTKLADVMESSSERSLNG